jgi:hypothetical protein
MESVRSYLPPVSAFPVCSAGRLLHRLFRGLLCVYCTLRPADSPSRLKRPSTSEAPATSSPPVPLRLLPGGANQFPGGTFNPRWTSAFHGARDRHSYPGKTQTIRAQQRREELLVCHHRKHRRMKTQSFPLLRSLPRPGGPKHRCALFRQ